MKRGVRFLLVLVLTAALLPGLGAAAQAAQPAAGKRLVTAVVHAKTAAAKLRPLEAMAGALGIAVENGRTGAWVVKGSRVAETKGQLYTEQLEAIAWATAKHRWVSMATLAQVLDGAGFTQGQLQLTPANLADAVTTAARLSESATLKDAKGWLGIRMVRQLGLARGQDLAKTAPSALTRLDPVQALLLTLDFTEPLIRVLPPPAKGRAAVSLAVATRGLTSAEQGFSSLDCQPITPVLTVVTGTVEGALVTWVLKFVYRHSPKTAALAAALAKAVHTVVVTWRRTHWAVSGAWAADESLVLSATVNVSRSLPDMPIHLGDPPVRFGIHVSMTYEFTDRAIYCGFLSGVELPKSGDVAGVRVYWSPGKLLTFGTTDPAGPSGSSVTDKSGWAYLTFSPKPDYAQDGPVVTVDGQSTAFADVKPAVRASAVTDDTVEQVLPWKIAYHPAYSLVYTARLTGSDSGPVVTPDENATVTTTVDEGVTGTIPLTPPDPASSSSYGSGSLSWTSAEEEVSQVSGQAFCAICDPQAWFPLNGAVTADGTEPATFDATWQPGPDPNSPWSGADLTVDNSTLSLLETGSGFYSPGDVEDTSDLDGVLQEARDAAPGGFTGFASSGDPAVAADLTVSTTSQNTVPGMVLTQHFQIVENPPRDQDN